jgi:hypothetical protein
MLAWMDWSGVIVGVLALLHVAQGRLGRSRAADGPDPRPAFVALSSLLVWASLLALAAYLLTLPTKPPFQPGQLLGKSILLGAILALWCILLLLRLRRPGEPEGGDGPERVWVAPAACALVAVNVVFLVWRRTPVEPMLGLSLSAVLFGVILRYGLGALSGLWDGSTELSVTARQAEHLALLTVTGAAAVALAVEHFPDKSPLWSLPIALGAVTVVAAVTGDALGRLVGQDLRRPVTSGGAVAIAAGAAALVAAGAFEQAFAAYCYFTGLVVMGLAVWLLSSGAGGGSSALRTGVIAGLLAVGTFVIAFRLMAGLGATLALQAAWLFPLLIAGRPEGKRPSTAEAVAPLLGLGLLFVLYRLNQQLVPMGRPGDLLAHYGLIAVALGLLVPFLWQAYLLQSHSVTQRRAKSAEGGDGNAVFAVKAVIGHLAALGLVVAGAPALLYLLWPRYAVGGYLMGLFLAQLVLVVHRPEAAGPVDRRARGPATGLGLLCAAGMLAAIPACRLLASVGDMPRLDKAFVAAVVVLALYAWGWTTSRRPDEGEGVRLP